MTRETTITAEEIRAYEAQARQLRAEAMLTGLTAIRTWFANLLHPVARATS